MKTLFTTSLDHVLLANDYIGNGVALFLVHGGGCNRQVWPEVGYVERLWEELTVISLDLRGHGESDLPTDPADYTTGKIGRDNLAIADACGVELSSFWGCLLGAKSAAI